MKFSMEDMELVADTMKQTLYKKISITRNDCVTYKRWHLICPHKAMVAFRHGDWVCVRKGEHKAILKIERSNDSHIVFATNIPFDIRIGDLFSIETEQWRHD